MNRRDWLLLLLADAGDPGGERDAVDRVRLQKGLFVLGRHWTLRPPAFYDFQPYYYGPFDKDVYRDAEALAAEGFVEIVPGRYVAYRATKAGLTHAATLRRSSGLSDAQAQFLRVIRSWVQRLDFNTLVRAIYQQWPDMRQNSIFQG